MTATIEYLLRKENAELKILLTRYSPDKRLLTHAGSFFVFFVICFLGRFLGVPIMEKTWNWLGFITSFGFIVMSQYMRKDLENRKQEGLM